jgi:phage shock protein C
MTRRRRHSRYDRRRSRLWGDYQRATSRRRNGWGMGLYRNTRRGRIAGVAAGLADYWDVATWVVRLLWIGAFLFTGTLALWAYVAAWILMAPRPTSRDAHYYEETWEERVVDEPDEDADLDMEYDEFRHDYRPRKMFRYSDSASVRLRRARERLDAALARVEDMEGYVTSRQYSLNKEFSNL